VGALLAIRFVKGVVMTMVRFTRCLYAMLASQRFDPPKVFAPYIPPEEHPDHHAHVLGMKLVRILLSWVFSAHWV
jgi:hypothetical protein